MTKIKDNHQIKAVDRPSEEICVAEQRAPERRGKWYGGHHVYQDAQKSVA